MKNHIFAILIVSLCTLGIFLWTQKMRPAPQAIVDKPQGEFSSSAQTKETLFEMGSMDFSLPSNSVSGEAMSLEQLRGKPTLIYVFLATCPHCKAFYPKLEEMALRWQQQGLNTVLFCGTRSTELEIGDFKNLLHPKLPMIQDVDKAFQNKYQISMIPTVFLVDRNGQYKRLEFDQLKFLESEIPSVLR